MKERIEFILLGLTLFFFGFSAGITVAARSFKRFNRR